MGTETVARATSPSGFSLEFARNNGQVVVSIAGELDVCTAPTLQERLDDLIKDQGNLVVALDLSALTFISSVGLSVIVRAFRTLREMGGELTLSRPSKTASKVLEMTGIGRIVPIVGLQAWSFKGTD